MLHKLQTRIMVFGTFDILHKGHLNFFRQARNLARRPYLIVSIARDVNVKKIKKRLPQFSEKQRLLNTKKNRFVDKVVLGGVKNYLNHIFKEKPDIIALGYDQKAYTKNLKKLLVLKGLYPKIIRLKPYKADKFKTSLLKNVKIIKTINK